MSGQCLAQQQPDGLVSTCYPLLEPMVVDLLEQRLWQSQADRLLGYRFVFHITDIIDINCGDSIIVTDISDVVNGDMPYSGYSP